MRKITHAAFVCVFWGMVGWFGWAHNWPSRIGRHLLDSADRAVSAMVIGPVLVLMIVVVFLMSANDDDPIRGALLGIAFVIPATFLLLLTFALLGY